jgi:hypothetical protein
VLVESYDSATGVVTLQTALMNYHWGAPESTAADYNGVDMRGEVLSLTRNIQIWGEEVDGFGGQILTSDIMEFDGSFREGETHLDSVELQFMGQPDTEKAAIRFENALTHSHTIENCSIHNSKAFGLFGFRSMNLFIDNNVIWASVQFAVRFDEVMAVTFNNNYVGQVIVRLTLEVKGMGGLDSHAGVAVCSMSFPSQCP